MFYSEDEVRHLKQRIATLENENRLLRERLAEVGGSRAEITADNDGALYDPNQGARIKSFEITDKVANDFFMMFCRGRKEVYDLRYTNPKTGKTGYYTQCFNRWNQGVPYTKARWHSL